MESPKHFHETAYWSFLVKCPGNPWKSQEDLEREACTYMYMYIRNWPLTSLVYYNTAPPHVFAPLLLARKLWPPLTPGPLGLKVMIIFFYLSSVDICQLKHGAICSLLSLHELCESALTRLSEHLRDIDRSLAWLWLKWLITKIQGMDCMLSCQN